MHTYLIYQDILAVSIIFSTNCMHYWYIILHGWLKILIVLQIIVHTSMPLTSGMCIYGRAHMHLSSQSYHMTLTIDYTASRLVCLVQRLPFMKENSPFFTRSQKYQASSGILCTDL